MTYLEEMKGLERNYSRAYVLSVLSSFAYWGYMWRRHDQTEEYTKAKAQREAFNARALTTLVSHLGWALGDADPQVRSMGYQLMGAVEQYPPAFSILVRAMRHEQHNLARAYALSGLLGWLVRNPGSPAGREDVIAEFRKAVDDAADSDQLKNHLRGTAKAVYRLPEQQTLVRCVLGDWAEPDYETRDIWPAEAL